MAAAAADPSYYNHLALHIRPSQPYNTIRSFVPFSALLPHSSSSSFSKSIEGV